MTVARIEQHYPLDDLDLTMAQDDDAIDATPQFCSSGGWPQINADNYQDESSYSCLPSITSTDFMGWSSSPTTSTASFPNPAEPSLAYDFNFNNSDYTSDSLLSPTTAAGADEALWYADTTHTRESDDGLDDSSPSLTMAAQQALNSPPCPAPGTSSTSRHGHKPSCVASLPPSNRSRKPSSPGKPPAPDRAYSSSSSRRSGGSSHRAVKVKSSPLSGSGVLSLRTASRKPKPTTATPPYDAENSNNLFLPSSPLSTLDEDDDEEATPAPGMLERRQRHNHNLVEKQYRNRLNAQFEHLLSALHVDDAVIGGATGAKRGGGATSYGSENRRMSKAEVLDLARRHIINLEKERRQLQAEKKAMVDRFERMQAAVMQHGMEAAASRR